MRYFSIYSFVTIGTFIFSACQTQEESSKLKKAKFEVLEEVFVPESNIIFDDSEGENLLFHNPISGKIIAYNLEKKEHQEILKKGSNYDEYLMLFNNNVFFYDEKSIGVGLIDRILIYDLNEKTLQKSLKVERRNTYAPLMGIKRLEQHLLAINSPQGDFSDPQFYQQQHPYIFRYQLSQNTSQVFGTFPEKDSETRNSEYYFIYPAIYKTTIQKQNKEYWVIGQNDPLLTVYDITLATLKRTKKLTLPHYRPVKYTFGTSKKYIINEDADILLNSSIQGIFSLNAQEFAVVYKEGLSEEVLKSAIQNNPSFLKTRPERICWLAIFDKEGTLKGEIRIPDDLGIPIAYYTQKQCFVFQKPLSQDLDAKNQTSLALVKINYLIQ